MGSTVTALQDKLANAIDFFVSGTLDVVFSPNRMTPAVMKSGQRRLRQHMA